VFAAVLMTVATAPTCFADTIVREIRVIDNYNVGVKSGLFERTRDGKELRIEVTNEDGTFVKEFKCPDWHQLIAKPVSGPYTNSRPEKCAQKVVLHVTQIKYLITLAAIAHNAEVSGDPGTAAKLYNEYYASTRFANPEKAEVARVKTLGLVGQRLRVENATTFDTTQGKEVATVELIKALAAYQKENDLRVTRKIDSATLRSMSNMQITDIYRACNFESEKCLEAPKDFEIETPN